jgi:hypothetical protein
MQACLKQLYSYFSVNGFPPLALLEVACWSIFFEPYFDNIRGPWVYKFYNCIEAVIIGDAICIAALANRFFLRRNSLATSAPRAFFRMPFLPPKHLLTEVVGMTAEPASSIPRNGRCNVTLGAYNRNHAAYGTHSFEFDPIERAHLVFFSSILAASGLASVVRRPKSS